MSGHERSYPETDNDPKVLAKLLRSIAGGGDAKVSKHDIIFIEAARWLEHFGALAQTEQDWKSLYENAVRKHIECDAELGKEIASLRGATIEECAQIAEAQKKAFLLPGYAFNQPMGSFCERFACDEVANAIRALAVSSTEVK